MLCFPMKSLAQQPFPTWWQSLPAGRTSRHPACSTAHRWPGRCHGSTSDGLTRSLLWTSLGCCRACTVRRLLSSIHLMNSKATCSTPDSCTCREATGSEFRGLDVWIGIPGRSTHALRQCGSQLTPGWKRWVSWFSWVFVRFSYDYLFEVLLQRAHWKVHWFHLLSFPLGFPPSSPSSFPPTITIIFLSFSWLKLLPLPPSWDPAKSSKNRPCYHLGLLFEQCANSHSYMCIASTISPNFASMYLVLSFP